LGGTGTAKLAEIAWQLPGRAGERQVGRHRVGLVETMGGGAARMGGNACGVTILSVP
jgi:acetyl-CoA C-acetyltransferase